MAIDAARAQQRLHGRNWSLSIRQQHDLAVCTMLGEFDVAVSRRLSDALAAVRPGRVVADLTRVSFCDSSCLRVLLQAARRAREAGGGFVLASAVPAVTRPIRLLALDDLPVTADLEAACSALARVPA